MISSHNDSSSNVILATRRIHDSGLQLLREAGYRIDFCSETERIPTLEEICEKLSSQPYCALISLLTDDISSDVFNASHHLKIICNYAAGYNNINLKQAQENNVVICNTPGEFSKSIAEHAIALMLALSTRIVEADYFVRAGQYKGWSPSHFIGTDLFGKTLGIIGAGNIGSHVARIASQGLEMNVIYHDISRNMILEEKYNALYIENLDDLISQSDVISIHVPLLPSTHHLFTKDRLSLMKKSSFIINTSRGAVIDENALAELLLDNKIGGAGLDVFEFEPDVNPALIGLPHVVLTPHIASARESARKEMSLLVAQNILSFFKTGKAIHEVRYNKEHE
jgi:glyoxylate reductase